MTLEQLAQKAGISESYLSRLEGGSRPLRMEHAEKLAMALETTVAEIFDLANEQRKPSGFQEDFIPYVPQPADAVHITAAPNTYLFEVCSDALDRAGISRGDVVAVTDDQAICANPAPLAAVRVRLHPKDDFMKPVSLLRQFVPPTLLITNSSTGQAPMIDMDDEDAHIVGVVLLSHRRFSLRP